MGEMICAVRILRVLCAEAVAVGDGTLVSNNKVWSEWHPIYHVSLLSEYICTVN